MSAVMQASTEMELSEPSSARLRADMAPLAAVQLLIDAGETPEALKLLARLLPKRYAVAWLCQCARDQPLSMEDKAGAALAEAWVRDPDEPRRRAALDFASAGEYRSLGAWIAASAGWSGGSLAPATQEAAVPPATPAMRATLETRPSIAPKTAGRNQPPVTSACSWPICPSASSGTPGASSSVMRKG